MKYDPEKHHRRSIRLKGYDYTSAGAYFVTIVCQERQCILGKVADGCMFLNRVGEMVRDIWAELPERYPNVVLDEFIVMPNHVHGIIVFVGAGLALPNKEGAASSAPTLADVVRAFKSISAIHVIRILMRTGHHLWQRNYYEHIIRNENDLDEIRRYIAENPMRWDLDSENPNGNRRGRPLCLP